MNNNFENLDGSIMGDKHFYRLRVFYEDTDSGQIVEIIIEGEVCGFTEIPEIQINSKTGAGAVFRPVLSFTKITDFSEQEVARYQSSTLSVVQCIPR